MARSKPKQNSFVDRVVAQLSLVCPAIPRAMFGGYGLFADETIFGLIAYDILYFKVDEHNRGDYVNLDMSPFTYMGKHKPIQMSYYQVPESVFNDLETLAVWVEKAIAAGHRAKVKQKRKSRPEPN
ncbi:TfoX/Sxy family protein [Pseudanabaena sp. PCC 6802]|uniref:TfoX/Sxy family protein n=1 Tax=Pseudanabaena sp. PCC 6802 TaxID=118173 RepID=UPI00034948B9|nr:TfoX/Sxy family protein [Pseudanabaena sp. PCC 6802]